MIPFFEILLTFVFIFYAIENLSFIFGILKLKNKSNHKKEFVSVVVAARNEKQNIKACVESISKSNYPKKFYEIIVVDDQSTDNTFNILNELSNEINNLKILKSPLKSTLIGKSNAIDYGIENSNGEFILMTDADCIVNPNWINEVISNFDDKTGIVAGMTIIRSSNLFTGMQTLDWSFILGIGAASIANNNPLSVIGNNFSIRKSVYYEIGGYRNLKFSVTEDFMLFKKIVETTNWKSNFILNENSLVETFPCTSLTDLIKQKKRWAIGGLDMKFSGIKIMIFGFLMHSLILVFPLYYSNLFFTTSIIVLKIFLDFSFLFLILNKINKLSILKYFPIFQFYYIIYVLVLPIFVFFTGKLEWKGRKY